MFQQLAKSNVETEYAVVGLTEDFRTSLKVMASFVPVFLGQVPWSQHSASHKEKKHKFLNKSSIDVLKMNMSLELELYDFVKRRLYQQEKVLDNLGLGPDDTSQSSYIV